MKRFIYILIVFTSFGCTNDFQNINTNPNFPVDVEPSLLFRKVIYNYGEAMSYEGFVAGNLLSQQLTALDFNLFDRHALKSPQLGGNPWSIFYTNLRDNEIVLNKAKNESTFSVYEGPALIFKAYMTMALTDLFGDVPYSEAFSGDQQTVTPKYDSQQSIYLNEEGILDNLQKGIAAIENYSGSLPLEGDVLYNGNLSNWIKFANSLRIKALLRISSKQDISSDLQAIVSDGNYISASNENAIFQFTDGEPNNFRMARLRAGDFNNFVLSETLEDVLKNLNDPRIETLFQPFGNSTNEYNGLINGIDASQTTISLSDYSLAGTIFREETGKLKANYMTHFETKFLLAEAALKGFITNNPQEIYNAALVDAFEYWNVSLPDDYLMGTAAYNTANALEQIITQKWIANFINGYEGWIEYRRTGFPNLKSVSASLNNELIPVRMPYPAEEETLNNANYSIAAEATDNNSINFKVWWAQ
ncbi:Starch-binding associating with outer membrane [Tenacibaculum sp. MAR_2009_124]|uniref:SusD/RagB family nutrient-binding outer membrane lipoprotein n=1 Tax=Tenacibaculum sp. MAR_2009_124 TaxID=1250059 RepID=UPI000895E51A|nr:SusD/RagB family nutrient-binding outer membrane lipoprotein [Tenacibaculum sp. MAR_2009_124]SEC31911.1 Starch-binding associating with outer membrane [Tenacibaculum sp. MAR_2009_124]